MTKRRLGWLAVLLSVVLALTLVAGCAKRQTEAPASTSKSAKDKIVIGHACPLSGPFAQHAAVTSLPIYEMWVEEVNAQGGIYVKEYGKKLPIEYIKYDDKSDLGTMCRLLEKLILEDKVDFLFPPWSTEFLYAGCPIANKHHYIVIGGAGAAMKLKEVMPNLPYVFMVLNFAETQIPVLIDVFKELGIKSVAIIYHDSLHGVEYHDFAVPRMKEAGFEVKMDKQFPMSIKDLSPLLKEAKGLNVDALVGFMYLEEGMLLTRQAMELGINFKAFFLSAVPFTPVYRDTFGAKAVEGVMGGGAWNAKSPGGKTFIELYRKHYNSEVCDYWGPLHYWASLQHFQQAIEEAGTLDQDKIRDLLATRTYDTIIGPFKYDPDRFFRGHVGQIGQWQNGVFEVVDPGKNRTAPPILKPDWPKKK